MNIGLTKAITHFSRGQIGTKSWVPVLVFALLLIGCTQKERVKPNVIFILADQWRANALGYNGNQTVKTPELDAFSAEAVNFKNAVSVTPVCTPYRASILTGKNPSTTGMFLNDLYLPAGELTMAEIYKEAGYQTAYLGKWHLDGHGRKKFIAPERRQGFDFWKASECDHNHQNEHYYSGNDTTMQHWEGYSPFAISEEAQRYMEQSAALEDPFLLFMSLSSPHFPHHTALKEYVSMYPSDSLTLPANVPVDMKEWALRELTGYYAHCTATDKAIGAIIQKIKDLGIYENSIIVFTSDHGEMMGSHGFRPFMKHQPYLESANVPFLISYPKSGVGGGQTAKAAISSTDVLPSLLALSGIVIPEDVEGYDLSHIMQDPSKDEDRAALFMNLSPFAMAFPTDEYRAVKTDKYTYVKTLEGPAMLFNDANDPLQMTNLINDSEYAEVQEMLELQLMEELQRIGEEDIRPRKYYTDKFGYTGRDQFREDLAIKDYNHVEVVVSPKQNLESD